MKTLHVLSIATIAMASGVAYSTGIFAHGADDESTEMQYIQDAKDLNIRQLDGDNANAFLEDIVTSGDKETPISCGLFRMEKGNPLTYTYEYPEAKVILEGQMTISDGKTTVSAEPGDVLFFPINSTITFSSSDYGLGFTCGLRSLNGT